MPCTEPEPISLLPWETWLLRLAASWLVACGPSYHPPLYKSARRNAPTAPLYAAGWTPAYLHGRHGQRETFGQTHNGNSSERDLVRGLEVLGVQGMMPMGLGAMSDLGEGEVLG